MAIPIHWRQKLNTPSTNINNHPSEPQIFISSQNKFKAIYEINSKMLYMQLMNNLMESADADEENKINMD